MLMRIEKIITGGQGLARSEDGMVVLTRFVLPGESVEVRETRQHRGYLEAEAVRVLQPSPQRVIPPCSSYTVCGGCDFQHLAYQAQLEIKDEITREALLRAGIRIGPEILRPTLPSPREYGYRARIRVQVDAQGRLGFFGFRSNRLVHIDRCPVAAEPLNSTLQEFRTFPLPAALAPAIREIDLLLSPADGRVHALLQEKPGMRCDRRLLARYASSLSLLRTFCLQDGEKTERMFADGGADQLRQDFPQEICGRPFSLRWPPGCFSQVNAEQNERLIRLVLDLAGGLDGIPVLDLFCGMGNFSVPLALAGARVTGVEVSRRSVEWARGNAAAAGCGHAGFIAADVTAALGTPALRKTAYGLIVLDPPRQGLGKACGPLADLDAPRIIYISCDPATLMRDLAALCARGYHLQQLVPVDMFPQTHHIETVAFLEKN